MIDISLFTQKEISRLEGDNERLLKEIEHHPKEIAEMKAKMEAAVAECEHWKREAEENAYNLGNVWNLVIVLSICVLSI